MSLTFHGIFKTIGYCEIDPRCKDVLQSNMKRQWIDTAPVYHDVKQLQCHDIPKVVDVITAGFPCQNLSVLNSHSGGIHGPKSSLFYHVARLARGFPNLKLIVLENVANIVGNDLDVVEQELQRIGFELTWSIFTACEIGGLHERRRWIGIASRKSGHEYYKCLPHEIQKIIENPQSMLKFRNKMAERWNDWTHQYPLEPSSFLSSVGSKQHANQRNKMLGNSLVPPMILFAFCMLSFAKSNATNHQLSGNKGPLDALIHVNNTLIIPKPFCIKRVPMNIISSNKEHRFKSKFFYTPVFTDFCWFVQPLTNRSHRLLATQLANLSSGYKQYYSNRLKWFVRPDFTEYLMGYPQGYTNTSLMS